LISTMTKASQISPASTQLHAAAATARRIAARRETSQLPAPLPPAQPLPAAVNAAGAAWGRQPPGIREREAWIRCIAAGLSAAGLITDVHETPAAGLDVSAIARQPGRRDTEAVVDEDGYVELRWWVSPDATARQTTELLLAALAAISAAS
jgi:hypothetical protein